jgi:opacity protein-like surface antigen
LHDVSKDTVDFIYEGFGYQLIVGAEAKVASDVSLIGEVRYQNGFDDLEWESNSYAKLSAPVTAVLAGAKFGF